MDKERMKLYHEATSDAFRIFNEHGYSDRDIDWDKVLEDVVDKSKKYQDPYLKLFWGRLMRTMADSLGDIQERRFGEWT